MTAIRGAIFDMDGTLLDTESLCLAAFRTAAEDQGLSDVDHVFLACVGLRGDLSRQVVADHLGGRVDLRQFQSVWDRDMLRRLDEGIDLKPGVEQLLGHLTEAGIALAVATSTRTEPARRHLEDAGILGFFQTVIGGDQVTDPKPHPEIYLNSAAALGLEAHHCAAFEDSDPGTRAAVASGAVTVQVPDMKPPGEGMPALGHVIAADLLTGARRIGLIGAQAKTA